MSSAKPVNSLTLSQKIIITKLCWVVYEYNPILGSQDKFVLTQSDIIDCFSHPDFKIGRYYSFDGYLYDAPDMLKEILQRESDEVLIKGLDEIINVVEAKDYPSMRKTNHFEPKEIPKDVLKQQREKARQVIAKLRGEDKNISHPSVNAIELQGIRCLEKNMKEELERRLREISRCMGVKSYLAVLLLVGSVLEGLLMSVATDNEGDFRRCMNKGQEGKDFSKWSLGELIDVAHKTNWIENYQEGCMDVLRNFRNYIHPRQALEDKFYPQKDMVNLALEILTGIVNTIKKKQQENDKMLLVAGKD